MTARIYRYSASVDTVTLQRKVNGSPTFNASSPAYRDVNGDDSVANQKANLDEYMKSIGFDYLSTDPGDTPTAAAAAALGTASFDIRDVLAFDHFIVGSTSAGQFGAMGWRTLINGTGSDITPTGEAGHPGIADMGAGSTATGRVGIYLGDASIVNLALGTTQNEVNLEFLLRLNANTLLSTSNERFVLGFGDTFDASAGTEMTNGIYLELNPSLSANFKLVTSAAGTKTRTDTTFTPVANTWYRVVVRITYPGGTPTAEILINGTSRCTATANFPSAGLGIGARLDANANSAEPRFQLDYCRLTQVTAKET